MIACEKCGGKGDVVDSRHSLGSVTRRRECRKCRWRWSTHEVKRELIGELREQLNKQAKLLDQIKLLIAGKKKR